MSIFFVYHRNMNSTTSEQVVTQLRFRNILLQLIKFVYQHVPLCKQRTIPLLCTSIILRRLSSIVIFMGLLEVTIINGIKPGFYYTFNCDICKKKKIANRGLETGRFGKLLSANVEHGQHVWVHKHITRLGS